MPDSKTIDPVQNYALRPEDVKNIQGRLNAADYFHNLAIADSYEYLRKVVLKRLGIPEDWAIIHNEDWSAITVVAPHLEKEYREKINEKQ